MNEMQLSESRLQYVLTIYDIEMQHGVARSREIADTLGVSRPSVTGALKLLSDRGLVDYEPYGQVRLTSEGSRIARQVLLRHRAAYDFFVSVLGMSKSRADEIAGEIEKRLPSDLLCRLVQFNDYYKRRTGRPFHWSASCSGLCATLYGEDPSGACQDYGDHHKYEEAAAGSA